MYVRFPNDIESRDNPRIFICGRVNKINEIRQMAQVEILDPELNLQFFYGYPTKIIDVPYRWIKRCYAFQGSTIYFDGEAYIVEDKKLDKESGYYIYWLKNIETRKIIKAFETNVEIPFNNGKIEPTRQLASYEFQNPIWNMGFEVVMRNNNFLDNSIYGLKELAGCKIFLLPHQMNTIMRCLEEEPCRYMLADEVGMGKTIEAASVLKLYLNEQGYKDILILVPDSLKEQWKTELLFKFNITQGENKNGNNITILGMSELDSYTLIKDWDFLIIDEVHKYLGYQEIARKFHLISSNSENVLLLSATPVQHRTKEYLGLLQILSPMQYADYSVEEFEKLLKQQNKIVTKIALILDDLEDYEEEIESCLEDEGDPKKSEDCQDLFDSIQEGLEEVCNVLQDDKLEDLFNNISMYCDDYGVLDVKVLISYISSNYQVESHIIRNRRKLLEGVNENEDRKLPIRTLTTMNYEMDADVNTFEAISYGLLCDWIEENKGYFNQNELKKFMNSFFSSSEAYFTTLIELEREMDISSQECVDYAKKWKHFEHEMVKNIRDYIDDPDQYMEYGATRLGIILNYLYEECEEKKIVLFTNYIETFRLYKQALVNLFDAETISFFGEDLDQESLEYNAYRFQNEDQCRIMLCDTTGGEGRNFQCADDLIHIDLPWDASLIEQRIGRLDRLERNLDRPYVNSVVVYAHNTIENSLFDFWNKGLNIFQESLSGMEIIMKEINESIFSAIEKDFKYGLGLEESIPHIVEETKKMRNQIRTEQKFDISAIVYRPMYKKLSRLIEDYTMNESEIFESTMRNWGALAGFKGKTIEDDKILYSPNSFSIGSAYKSQFLPPKWESYEESQQSELIISVEERANKVQANQSNRAIIGTFNRRKGIENDYLHFFAPGDPIFDSIINNAIYTSKGRSCAFAMQTDFNWDGLIFCFTFKPELTHLLDHGLSPYILNSYKSYMLHEPIYVAVSINNGEQIPDQKVLRSYFEMVNLGIHAKNKVLHLGKRSNSPSFMREEIGDQKNINWFKLEYPKDEWRKIVSEGKKEAVQKALKIARRKSDIKGLKAEMDRIESARIARTNLFEVKDDTLEDFQIMKEDILNAIQYPKMNLESVAYIRMVKKNDDETEEY